MSLQAMEMDAELERSGGPGSTAEPFVALEQLDGVLYVATSRGLYRLHKGELVPVLLASCDDESGNPFEQIDEEVRVQREFDAAIREYQRK